MTDMTWREFKDAVDKQLREHDIDENTSIWFIDVESPQKIDFDTRKFSACADEEMGLAISSFIAEEDMIGTHG